MKKLFDIIETLNDHLINLKKNHSHNIYFENSDKENKIIDNEINRIGESEKAEYVGMPLNKTREVIEYDLFGNVLQKKEEWELSNTLDELYEKINECQKCPLGSLRTKFVFGSGNPTADVVFVGEAPGRDEDLQGLPFVGRAGQLLTKIIEATGFKREDVYICNILKSRPPDNRVPLPEEVEMCKPYLDHQLKLIKPKFIIALGKTASESLLGIKASMTELREKVHTYHGIKLIVTYHPAALLRNNNLKVPTWKDMQFFKKLYDES